MAPIESYDKMKVGGQKNPEDQQKEMEAWTTWMNTHKDNIVDPGGGVGSAKRVSADGQVSDKRNEIGGYMIIEAESADSAAAIFKDSPLFGMEEAGIEVMEIMEM